MELGGAVAPCVRWPASDGRMAVAPCVRWSVELGAAVAPCVRWPSRPASDGLSRQRVCVRLLSVVSCGRLFPHRDPSWTPLSLLGTAGGPMIIYFLIIYLFPFSHPAHSLTPILFRVSLVCAARCSAFYANEVSHGRNNISALLLGS